MANKNFVVRHGLEVSGQAVVAGNLQVSGATILGNELTVAGNTSIKGNVVVSGQTQVTGVLSGGQLRTASFRSTGTLTVQGASYLSGAVTAKGTLSVAGSSILSGTVQAKNTLSVAGSSILSGAVQAKNTLSVGGTATIAATTWANGHLRIGTADAGIAMDPNEIYFAGAGNIGTISGSLTLNPANGQILAGNSTLAIQTIAATGNIQTTAIMSGTQLRTASFRSTGTLTVQGASYLSGAVTAKGTLSVGGALTVAGNTSIKGNVVVSGQTQVTGVLSGGQLRTASFNATGTLTVQGASYLSGAVTAKGTLSVAGSSILSGTVQAKGVLSGLQLRTASFRSTGTLTVQGASYLSGAVTAKGTLSVGGSAQVAGLISGGEYNFEPFGAVPAYNNGNYGTIKYNAANHALVLDSGSDTQIGMAFPAFRVNSATPVLGRWRITIQVKSSAAAASGFYIRVYEYDAELPSGKVAVSNDAINADVQEDTRQGVQSPTFENTAITTGWVTKTFYYTPTATAVYASIVILNWAGMGTNKLYVKQPIIQPEYTGFVSSTTLRCASLRVTGGTAAICGSMDIGGSLQVLDTTSTTTLRATSSNLQRGNISAMTYGTLNGAYLSATTLRTTSFRVATTGYVCGVFQATQLRCASLRVTGGTAAICGSMDICGSLQVLATTSTTTLRATSSNLQRGNISAMTFADFRGSYLSAVTLRATSSNLQRGNISAMTFVDFRGSYLSAITLRYTSGSIQRDTTSLRISTGAPTYDKIRVWSSGDYTIGMTNALYHGGLNNDYAMTFTMNNSNTRGFLWRHSAMPTTQGAMSLTAGQGLLTVAGGVRIGYGLGDQTSPLTTGMQVNGTISCDAIHAGASAIETTGAVSATTLRCASLRVTGGTAAICGSMDISGSLQVRAAISCNGLHAGASAIDTTGIISGTTIRGTSCKLEESLFVSSSKTSGNTVEIRAGGTGNNFLLYQYAQSSTYGGTVNIMNAVRAATDAYQFLAMYSSNGSTTQYVFRGNGTAGAQGNFQSNSVDYAEYFEWKDGNPNDEPRWGQPVYLISGEKIALATSGNIPIGVVSKSPAFTTGSAWNAWEGRFLRDEWNALVLDDNGEQVENPNYNSSATYIPREERPEWIAVGLVGKLPIQKDYITDTIRNNTGWIKMSNINDNVERWLIK